MMKKRVLLVLMSVMVFAVTGLAQAQAVVTTPVPGGTTTTTTTASSNVTVFYVACLDQGVVNFSGTMLAGSDVYYQLYSGAGATGTALSQLRRASVDGAYRYSEIVKYAGGTVAAGQVGSIKVTIARENDPERVSYTTTVNDAQDGCSQPQFPLGSSTDAGTSTTTTTFPPILSPFGGFLNPGYNPSAEPVVVIGARNFTPPRQQTPGLIFAECNQYPIANPGLVYDTDRVVIFWSWYAKTPELVQEFIDNAIFEVGYFGSNPFIQPVVRSNIQQRGRNWWVFYTIDLGNVRPDTYYIQYSVRWEKQISDGFQLFGPGTAVERIDSNCDFTVRPNLERKTVVYTFP